MFGSGSRSGLFWLLLALGVGCLLALDLEYAPDWIAEQEYDGLDAGFAPEPSDTPSASASQRTNPFPIQARVPTIVARFESEAKTPTDESGIRILATAMIEDHEARIVLEGHSDQLGADDVNHDLSLERANTVKQRLVDLGVSEDRIETVGLGATHPLHSDMPDAASVNRRVEVKWITR